MECKKCGCKVSEEELMPEGHLHYSKMTCKDCKAFHGWGRKPDNEHVRIDRNENWKTMHREKHGKYICQWCGMDETLYGDHLGWKFQCDHIVPLSEGGKDEFDNTQILCFSCHSDKTERRKVKQLVYAKLEGQHGHIQNRI